jgi:two-component sensor histidine kinase
LSEAEREAERTSSETRHKLANVFQLLTTLTRMRMQRSRDEEARRQLSWMLDATSALALLHKRSHVAGSSDFSDILRDAATLWRRRCADRPIEIELDLRPVVVPERQEAALLLIAHELVVNAIAHGFPGEAGGVVRVSFGMADAETVALTVGDSGCGYDLEAVDSARLGLWLIGGLAGQVQGALTTTGAHGVQARLLFPLVVPDAPGGKASNDSEV